MPLRHRGPYEADGSAWDPVPGRTYSAEHTRPRDVLGVTPAFSGGRFPDVRWRWVGWSREFSTWLPDWRVWVEREEAE